MTAPSTDESAIRQIIAALTTADWTLVRVNNGEDIIDLTGPGAPETQALEEITATDAAYLFVAGSGGREGYVYFVLGNEPFEVACDYTTNLGPAIEPLTDGWF